MGSIGPAGFRPSAAMRTAKTDRANMTRASVAALKRGVKDGSIDWVECLRGAPPEEHAYGTERAPIEAFLRSITGIGQPTAEAIIEAAGVKPKQKLGEMGHGTRQHLARLALMSLDPYDPRLGAIDTEAIRDVETPASIDEPPLPQPEQPRTRWTGPRPQPPAAQPPYPPELDVDGMEP